MVASPVGRAANDEVPVAVARREFPGLGIFAPSGDDSRGIGQRTPIDAGADSHGERLRDVVNGMIRLVDKFDLKNQGILRVEPKDFGEDDVKSLIERLGKRLGLFDLRNPSRDNDRPAADKLSPCRVNRATEKVRH